MVYALCYRCHTLIDVDKDPYIISYTDYIILCNKCCVFRFKYIYKMINYPYIFLNKLMNYHFSDRSYSETVPYCTNDRRYFIKLLWYTAYQEEILKKYIKIGECYGIKPHTLV